MTANILTPKARCTTDCRTTFAGRHGASITGGPFEGTIGGPGEVRRCEHGRYWRWRDTNHRLDYWERLSWLWEPIVMRRARRALAEVQP